MNVKKEFELLKGTPNTLNTNKATIENYQTHENNPDNMYSFLKIHERSIVHFTKDKIFKILSDPKKRNDFNVVNFDRYILPITYNYPTNGKIINLKSFDVDIIAKVNPRNFYGAIVYAYSFAKLVDGKVKITESDADPIIGFLLSMFIKVFGKEYGLLGAYASGIPMLKFLISCYVFSSFFGRKVSKDLFRKASSIAPLNYNDYYDELMKYNFASTVDFIKSLSDFKVMSGMTRYNFTAKMLKFLSVNFLPALEDLSRFISIMLTTSISGCTLVPTFISKYNETEYKKIIDLSRSIFK